jgi:hypothetical protein
MAVENPADGAGAAPADAGIDGVGVNRGAGTAFIDPSDRDPVDSELDDREEERVAGWASTRVGCSGLGTLGAKGEAARESRSTRSRPEPAEPEPWAADGMISVLAASGMISVRAEAGKDSVRADHA